MLGQTVTVGDIPTVITLVLLEGLLSADNALVLAILVQGLPKPLQKKGLLYGLGGAFVLRGIAILVAAELMKYWWIEGAGAAYLFYLTCRHFFDKHTSGRHGAEGRYRNFWLTILVVELTDLAFAIDSILAAVGLVGGGRLDKLWVIYLGGMLGVVMMRFVAGFFLTLLERFARLETSAYLIIGWIAVKLAISSYGHFMDGRGAVPVIEHLPSWLFWSVMVVFFSMGFIRSGDAQTKRSHDDASH